MRDNMQGPRYRGRMQANRFTILLAVGLVACGLEDTDPVADGTETSGTTVEPHPQDLAPEPQADRHASSRAARRGTLGLAIAPERAASGQAGRARGQFWHASAAGPEPPTAMGARAREQRSAARIEVTP